MKESRLKSLQDRHARLESRLHVEGNRPFPNEVVMRELKKQKLMLRDEIMLSLGAVAA